MARGTKKSETTLKTEKIKKTAPIRSRSVETPSNGNKDLRAALQEYFGFDAFKGNQEAIIESLMAGKDTFVIKPTGVAKVFAINCRRCLVRALPSSFHRSLH